MAHFDMNASPVPILDVDWDENTVAFEWVNFLGESVC